MTARFVLVLLSPERRVELVTFADTEDELRAIGRRRSRRYVSPVALEEYGTEVARWQRGELTPPP